MFQQLMLIKFCSDFRGAFLFVLWFDLFGNKLNASNPQRWKWKCKGKRKCSAAFPAFPSSPPSTFPLSGCDERFAVLWRTDGNTCCCPQPHFLSRLCVCVVYRSAVELSIYCNFTFASSCYCWKAYNIPDRYRNLKENIFETILGNHLLKVIFFNFSLHRILFYNSL